MDSRTDASKGATLDRTRDGWKDARKRDLLKELIVGCSNIMTKC